MSRQVTVQSFEKRSKAAVLFFSAARGFLRAIPVLMLGILLLSSLDRWVELASWGRQVLWVFVVLGALAAFLSGFLPLSIFSLSKRSQNLSQRVSGMRTDDLRLAQELNVAHDRTSQELRDLFITRISDQLKSSKAWWSVPLFDWKQPLIAAFISLLVVGSARAFFPALFPIEARTFFPFWSFDVERKLKIEPGDARVALGKDVQIQVTVLDVEPGKPVLRVKTGDQWLELEATIEGNRQFTYVVKNLVSPLFYLVEWRGESSRRFKLTPVEALSIKTFEIKLTPPHYTGKNTFEQSAPEITGLAGTRIEMKISTSEEIESIKVVFSGKREVLATQKDKNTATFGFDLIGNDNYDFVMNVAGGTVQQTEAAYPIHVIADKSPTITLLAPDQDVVIGEKDTLPITYDARDDFGLGEILLEWETQNGANKRIRIAAFDGVVESSLSTYSWDLSLNRFPPGLAIRFRVGAVDKNKVTGPGEAWSAWRIVELRSFELEHAIIEKALEAWREKAVESLAQVTTLQKKMKSENPDMSTLSNEFNAAAKNLDRLEDGLKQITSKMEQDPLADYGVWMEHADMLKNLSDLNMSTVKNTQSAFQTQNKPAVSNNLENIANELERMTALSEDLSKNQKARDVTDAGENLENIGEDLMSTLENAKNDPAAMAKLNQLLSEAQKNLMDMASALQGMPEELPEDFVNQEAIKNLDLGKSQDILSQISEAVKQGDMKKAMALAQKFSDMAKAMRKQIDKAHESFLESHSAGELAKKMAEHSKELGEIADDQRQLLSETQKLASKQLDGVMKEQESILSKLAERQEKVLSEAKSIDALSSLLTPMSVVLQEFKAKSINKSPAMLEGLVAQLSFAQQGLAQSSATINLQETVARLQKEEASILDVLKNPPPPKPDSSSESESAYSDLENRQQKLREKTQSLRSKLQELSRKTASLSVPLMQSLGRAGTDMNGATSELKGKNGVSAQRSEEKALDSLLDGQAELQNAQSAMGEMAMQQGGDQPGNEPGGSGPKMILRKGEKPGGRGLNNVKVKLPKADDFRAPKAFREDLLNSLKENYPKIYEEIIHSYYKRLAQ